ncbi:polygalacturonase QRT3-like [Lotus japonicus]|uniref:polygalacturonase QRT3-like n=1 Tax=Lotus japonicus TaxID=34305 RepID=UPI002587E478|nr:polygalacturonase QRT3-like [Lotus japonicus]
MLSSLPKTMISFSMILAFLLSMVVQDSTCLSEEHIDLSHFRNKLIRHRVGIPLSQAPFTSAPSPSETARRGRVVNPIGYGADPTGADDSSDAILKAIAEGFAIGRSDEFHELVAGVRDLGGVVIDLQGGNYKISKPITFPSYVGNVVVQGGTLRASDKFPPDRHLVELSASNSHNLQEPAASIHRHHHHGFNSKKLQQNIGIYYEDITFRDIFFDSSYRGGGILIVDSARVRITNCFFLHFTTEGIQVQRGHETYISSTFLGQHSTVGGDKGEREFSGTAIDLASNDNAITDVSIFSAAIGIVLRGQANMITGVHCYNKATAFGGIGILVKLAGYSQTRIDNCYMDYTGIVMEDPVQVHVTNGFFLGGANIVLKSIKGKVSGLNIVDNMFSGKWNQVPIVALDGQFSSIDQVVIDRNNVYGSMSLRSTVSKLTVAGNGSKWVADFSNVLVFPNRISHFQYSFYSQGEPKFLAHSVTNVSNNVVVVESEKQVQGVVSFFIEQ